LYLKVLVHKSNDFEAPDATASLTSHHNANSWLTIDIGVLDLSGKVVSSSIPGSLDVEGIRMEKLQNLLEEGGKKNEKGMSRLVCIDMSSNFLVNQDMKFVYNSCEMLRKRFIPQGIPAFLIRLRNNKIGVNIFQEFLKMRSKPTCICRTHWIWMKTLSLMWLGTLAPQATTKAWIVQSSREQFGPRSSLSPKAYFDGRRSPF
jgi:hypothetical protein